MSNRRITAIALAAALAAALGGLGGIPDPMGEARRSRIDEFPRARRPKKPGETRSGPDPAKKRAKRKQAQRSRRANKK